ncbi:non-heme iron oxygenase ferredoxin subunit [Frankia sp. CNm7]|uniref:Rieske 2Fe-2S domain-containing protein n=1 Tax=Frankia nepalensis TaxID=1836974 RepID=UPI0019338191|nr:non-heme iron oxygenase ferredoxin subunit [Frankia nepalensis]MBL7519474.1 non-heme iron oxygenase ferredoxin subunit [Frankia nepalensis]
MRVSERVVERLEQGRELDPIAGRLASFWSVALRSERLRDLLSGRPLGHPLHPAAVIVPAGTLLSATLLDVTGGPGTRPAARRGGGGGRGWPPPAPGGAAPGGGGPGPPPRRRIGGGLLAAAPAAAAGWADWLDTEGAERRVGIVHATANLVGVMSYAASWWQRRRGGSGLAAGLAGATALGVGGWLGGHLAYALGVGVDTTAFQRGPADWTDALAASEVTAVPRAVDVDGAPVLLTRVNGRIVAIGNRCTHRGGPLADGERDGDRVTCPWHGSRFELASGEAVLGPATRPQPVYEVREIDGRVEIRRLEARALRANPVGPAPGRVLTGQR